MHEAEGVNFKVGVAGERDGPRPSPGGFRGHRYNNPNLEDVLSFIGRLSLSESEKKELAAVAGRIPHGALARFRDNYMNYLGKGGRT
jgi:hypothetical protein